MRHLTVLYTTTHADTLGNACRLEMIEFLSEKYITTIVTNCSGFIQQRFDKCKVIGFEDAKKRLPLFSDFNEWKRIAQIINETEHEVCFMFDDTSPVALYINKPVYQYVHQFGIRTNKTKNILKRIIKNLYNRVIEQYYLQGLKKSNMVFVVSDPIINILKNKGIAKLMKIPHGFYLDKFSKPLLSDFHKPVKQLKDSGYFIVAYAGWVTENRGYHLMMDSLLEAVKIDEKIALVIAGADQAFFLRIKQFINEHGVEKNILNFGVIDAVHIPGILHYADVCFSFLDDVPAYHISPPQKIIEYFASGKPVICNDIATHRWLVDDHITGFITQMDAQEVSQALLRFKQDETMYNQMSKNCLQKSLEYDINNVYGVMIEKMKAQIESVI